MSHSSWGLEASILRVAHDAVIVSLIRYGLTIAGPCLPEDMETRQDVQAINTAARRISDLPRTARTETLHFLSGTHSYRNLYIRQGAQFVQPSLVSQGSIAQR